MCSSHHCWLPCRLELSELTARVFSLQVKRWARCWNMLLIWGLYPNCDFLLLHHLDHPRGEESQKEKRVRFSNCESRQSQEVCRTILMIPARAWGSEYIPGWAGVLQQALERRPASSAVPRVRYRGFWPYSQTGNSVPRAGASSTGIIHTKSHVQSR